MSDDMDESLYTLYSIHLGNITIMGSKFEFRAEYFQYTLFAERDKRYPKTTYRYVMLNPVLECWEDYGTPGHDDLSEEGLRKFMVDNCDTHEIWAALKCLCDDENYSKEKMLEEIKKTVILYNDNNMDYSLFPSTYPKDWYYMPE